MEKKYEDKSGRLPGKKLGFVMREKMRNRPELRTNERFFVFLINHPSRLSKGTNWKYIAELKVEAYAVDVLLDENTNSCLQCRY